MSTRLCLIWLLAGCGSGGGQGTSGDTDTDTDTDSSASFGPTTDDTVEPTTVDPSDDESDPGTTMIDSVSGSGDSGSTSTGCAEGELGCPCLEERPQCSKGLECVRDVCAEPLCPDKEHEDNDGFNDAYDLGDYDDGDPADSFMSVLSGTQDVDWFRYGCQDTTFEDLDPSLISDTDGPMRICMFLECVNGGKPTPWNCPAGTFEETAPIGFIPGCCVDDSSTMNLSNYNCPDSSDDSVVVHIKAEMANEEACIGYTMTYNC